MVAPFHPSKQAIPDQANLADLPIPEAESLEDWVGYVCEALLEHTLSDEQVVAVMAFITSNPEAGRMFRSFYLLEAFMRDHFAGPGKSDQLEMVEEMASPIW